MISWYYLSFENVGRYCLMFNQHQCYEFAETYHRSTKNNYASKCDALYLKKVVEAGSLTFIISDECKMKLRIN